MSEYRIVSNGLEFSIERRVKLLWCLPCWVPIQGYGGRRVFYSQSDAENLMKTLVSREKAAAQGWKPL